MYVISLLFSIIAGFIVIIYLYFQYCMKYWKRKGVVYLQPCFPYGNTKLLIQEKISIGYFLHSIYKELKPKNKHFGGFYMLNKPVFFPISLDLVKDVLTKDFHHFNERGFFCDEKNDPLSANLIALAGEKWKKMRAKVTPNYTTNKIKIIFSVLLECSNDLKGIIDGHIERNEHIDITSLMKKFTTDNISSCAFGLNCNSLMNPDEEFTKYSKLYFRTTFSEAWKFLLSQLYPGLLKLFKIKFTNINVENFFLTAIKQIVEYRRENNVHRKDFLDYFIKLMNEEYENDDGEIKENPEVLTLNQVVAQAFIIYLAGYDTSSTALAFCFLELALNQDIQDKLRYEISAVLNRHNNEITYDGLMEMTYMDKVINETLRKYPPVPELFRKCSKDYKVPGTNIVIEKGTLCWISTYGIQRDPEYFPDPDKFDPERFSKENKIIPFSYIPFGAGPRECLGIKFGIAQMKIALTKIIHNNKIFLDPSTKLPLKMYPRGIILETIEPIWIKIVKCVENTSNDND